jgi:hypothetical protein
MRRMRGLDFGETPFKIGIPPNRFLMLSMKTILILLIVVSFTLLTSGADAGIQPEPGNSSGEKLCLSKICPVFNRAGNNRRVNQPTDNELLQVYAETGSDSGAQPRMEATGLPAGCRTESAERVRACGDFASLL